MSGQSIDYRSEVSGFLRLVQQGERALANRLGVPLEQLAEELCRFWLDEVYVPGDEYIDGVKGDKRDEDLKAFCEAFDRDELAHLARFNHFLLLRLKRLHRDQGSLQGLASSELWESIKRDAESTLSLFAVD